MTREQHGTVPQPGTREARGEGLRLFAAAIMIMIGMFHLVAGFAAVLRGSYFVVSEDYFLVVDVAVWGWGHLVLGVIVAATGAALFAERPWAYVSGIVIVGLSALGNFMFLPYQPLWAVLIIAVDVAVVWALAMRLRELPSGEVRRLVVEPMNLQVLPLAVTMMVGPQIMAATIFVMNARAIRVSAAFLAGVALATTAGVVVARGVASLLGGVVVSGGGALLAGWLGVLVQMGLVVLLLVLALVSFLGRGDARPPRWLDALMSATPSVALRTGLMVILTMPSDIVIMLTVGVNLDHHGETVLAAVPFIVATVLVASLPLAFYLVFRDQAERAMPRVRNWLNVNSWVVNVGVCLFFATLVAF